MAVLTLLFAVTAIWLGVTASRKARRSGTARPRWAVSGVVLGWLGLAFSALWLLVLAVFWPQLNAYYNCMGGANTVTAQQACHKQFTTTRWAAARSASCKTAGSRLRADRPAHQSSWSSAAHGFAGRIRCSRLSHHRSRRAGPGEVIGGAGCAGPRRRPPGRLRCWGESFPPRPPRPRGGARRPAEDEPVRGGRGQRNAVTPISRIATSPTWNPDGPTRADRRPLPSGPPAKAAPRPASRRCVTAVPAANPSERGRLERPASAQSGTVMIPAKMLRPGYGTASTATGTQVDRTARAAAGGIAASIGKTGTAPRAEPVGATTVPAPNANPGPRV